MHLWQVLFRVLVLQQSAAVAVFELRRISAIRRPRARRVVPFVCIVVAMCRAFFFVAVSCASAQTFPSGVAPLLSKLRAELDSAGSAGPDGAQALASSAAAELAGEVARERQARLGADVALAGATRDAEHFKYVGGCIRVAEGCPVSWEASGAGVCVPPDGYDGLCGATDVSALSVAQKEDFALSCKAAWPCQECRTDFQGCPSGWDVAGRLCVAPPRYDGICSPVMDFSGVSAAGKASWSATCSVRWPCGSR